MESGFDEFSFAELTAYGGSVQGSRVSEFIG